MNLFKGLPKLQELYAGHNAITQLGGYADLGALKRLHLRGNKIAQIGAGEEGADLPELPALEYLNLRSNALENMDDVFKLFAFATLSDLNIINCPIELTFSSMNLMIAQTLIKASTLEQKHTSLKRYCKSDITDVHRLEAVYLAKYEHGKAEEEAARKKAEEDAAAAAEEN